MSLRMVALETPRLCRSTRDFEPIGSCVETKSATIACKTSKRRSSALPIVSHLPHTYWPRLFYGLDGSRPANLWISGRYVIAAGGGRALPRGPVEGSVRPEKVRRKRPRMIFKGGG